jgi:hypothetical protein
VSTPNLLEYKDAVSCVPPCNSRGHGGRFFRATFGSSCRQGGGFCLPTLKILEDRGAVNSVPKRAPPEDKVGSFMSVTLENPGGQG